MNVPHHPRRRSVLLATILCLALPGLAPLHAAPDGEEVASVAPAVFAPAVGDAFGLAPDSPGTAHTATAAPPRHLSTDRLIVKFRDPATREAAVLSEPQIKSLSARAGVALHHLRPLAGGAHLLRLPGYRPLAEAQALASALAADPSIEYAEPDAFMRRLLVPNDALYASQWHYKEFTSEIGGANLPAAWDITTGSAATVVAVIDTGLVPHADLDGNLLDGLGRVLPGYDFISLDSSGGCNGQPCTANDGNGRDSDPSDPGDWITAAEDEGTDSTGGFFKDCTDPAPGGQASNSSWHGTHVAGTIGALSNNATGVSGINWNAKLLPVRVLGKCGGYLSDIAEGMRWAAGLSITGVPTNANPAKVLNLSLGGDGACGPTYQSAVDAVTAAGATVVVAAGNESSDVSNSRPANCNGVIAVAATTRTGAKASYSNFGSLIKIAAPGGGSGNGVLSTLNSGTTTPTASPAGDTYASYQGTSMATPHIAGIASLMLAVNPALTPAQVLSTLQATARAFPTGTGADCTTSTCGAGIVNAAAAVAQASNPPSLVLIVAKAGTGSGTVTGVVTGTTTPQIINCGSDCIESFGAATSVTLSASPAADSTFAGWSGGGCIGTGNCVVNLTANTTITAAFNAVSTVLPDCRVPAQNPTQFMLESLTMAYEVNGTSYCGGNSISNNTVWRVTLPFGTKVKVRYAARNATLYACAPTDSLFLWLRAPAMGINDSYLNSQGQWQPSFTYFRTVPPTSVWTDLYNDVPPKGDYVLDMGCDSSFRLGEIQFRIQ